MTKLIPIIFLILKTTLEVFGQCTPQPNQTFNSDSVDCIVQGEPVDIVIQGQLTSELGGFQVEWLKIDSIVGMPCGLSYTLSDPDLIIEPEVGYCIHITGVTNGSAGFYILCIYGTIKIKNFPGGGLSGSLQCGFFPSFPPVLRVKDSNNDTCPVIMYTADGPVVITEQGCVSVYSGSVGLEEIMKRKSSAILYPNPISNEFVVEIQEFKTGEYYEIRLCDAFGREVFADRLKGGMNKFNVERLESNIYLYRITHNHILIDYGKVVINK